MANTVTISKALLERLREYAWEAHETYSCNSTIQECTELEQEWVEDSEQAYNDYRLVGRIIDGYPED